VLLSTLAHELGHGVTALLVGGHFQSLLISADASGEALTTESGPVALALVCAGGLVGPACAAALLFGLARRDKLARASLVVLGAALAVAIPLVVVGTFGQVFVGLTAAVLLALGLKAPPWFARYTLAFVATQLALSVYSRGDYLFTKVAHTARGDFPSDVELMARSLALPYWFWGSLCALFSVVVLFLGTRLYLRGVGWRAGKSAPSKEPVKKAAPAPVAVLSPSEEMARILKNMTDDKTRAR
jgi:hypothetical protein